MKKTQTQKHHLLLCCIVLTLAVSFLTTGCSSTKPNDSSTPANSSAPDANAEPNDSSASDADAEPNDSSAPDADAEPNTSSDVTILGEGNTSFAFTVVDGDGNTTQFEIHTDKETVGEALLALELIAGDDSEYGLYVKTVNNITVDYDTDGKYWAFYVDDEYAVSGVDSTPITDGSSYAFKVE